MPDRRPAVTRADVAQLAGVSTAVVSYVVNGGPRAVSPATAARVSAAIDALGYRPNASARALRTGSSRLLGLILPVIDNPLFAELALAIERAATARGFSLTIAFSEGDPAKERQHIESLVDRQADGVMLTSVLARPDLAMLPLAGTPAVLVNAFHPTEGFASVGVDALAGAHEGVAHLIGHGHDTVALVIGGMDGGETELRERGWLEATRAAGLPDGPIARDEFSRAGGYRAALRLFGGGAPPSAVFVSSDMQAIGVLRALRELGLRVPDDVAIVAFDGTEDSEYTAPALTVVRQPVGAMAESAVGAVTGGAPAGHVVHVAELVLRRSCGCLIPCDS